ncbi:MAG: DUF45 domain-containing protein [Tenericutes bacterium]|nr:DUF45 domain-containing protein [Mycoplasmatota bacterium]
MNKIRLGNKDFYYQVFYKKNKNMYLRVKEGNIVITCNRLVKNNDIEAFILKNQFKILKLTEKTSKRVELYNQDSMYVFGKERTVHFQLNAKRNDFVLGEENISISFKKDYFDTLYIEKVYQTLLLKEIALIHSEEKQNLERYFDVSNIIFKSQLMKSRFGSCIAKRRIIKLNSILARFDRKYTKTILIHELIHLKVQNHQKGFYSYIDELIPNYKQTIREINQLSRKYVI